jgi:L-arabinose transport system ATP-binding protein
VRVNDPPPVLELRGVGKRFEGVLALDDVSMTVRPGEVVGLVGENGAGKSTLLRVLSGEHTPDTGSVMVNGVVRSGFDNPRDARGNGIRVIYQEPELVASLTVAENLFLGAVGQASTGGTFVRWPALYAAAAEQFDRHGLGAELDPTAVVGKLSPARRQLVEIVKALRAEPSVLALDEPTSSLAEDDVDRLLSTVERLRAGGVAIIYVSHRLREVRRVADRVVVLRDGRVVAEQPTSGVTDDDLVRHMVGRTLGAALTRAHTSADGPVRLRVDGLSTRRLREVSFTVRRGEIVGVAGLVGAGRSELARALFGATSVTGGRITVDGEPVRSAGPRAALDAGISMTPEDRMADGLVLARGVRENLTLAILRRLSVLRMVRRAEERRVAGGLVEELRVKASSQEQPVSTLSGGNQQKVVFGRALSTDPKVLLLDEPTRGVDVGAKAEIYRLIHGQAEQGVAVLLISSELPELLALADRVLVMAGGRITGELTSAEATEERLLALALPEAS